MNQCLQNYKIQGKIKTSKCNTNCQWTSDKNVFCMEWYIFIIEVSTNAHVGCYSIELFLAEEGGKKGKRENLQNWFRQLDILNCLIKNFPSHFHLARNLPAKFKHITRSHKVNKKTFIHLDYMPKTHLFNEDLSAYKCSCMKITSDL